ncbi:uncharacterized protein LOC123691836 [Colias croceus]|uniref:uncharacterized protein LOC123691836 n=1 Tax=Colias crocea TaxID=72248 RepID=UPI001E27EFCA|nr:uncharacterized protein LOC123691836 [Colias croceus]
MASRRKVYCVFGCSEMGAYMHRFPHPTRRPELFTTWMSIVGERLKDLEPDKIYRNKRVCDYHFKPEHKVSCHRLLNLSVPSINLNGIFPSVSTAVNMEHNYSQPRMWPCETRANEDIDVPLNQQFLDKGLQNQLEPGISNQPSTSQKAIKGAASAACQATPLRSHTPPRPPPPQLLRLSSDSSNTVAASEATRADLLAPSETSATGSVPASLPSSADAVLSEVLDKITTINAVNPVRSNHICISSFDPALNDFNVWCEEVDHLCRINRWDDRECLARIGNCLKGDARVWLSEWSTNERSWSIFKRDFQSLCPRRIDSANILFEVMKTDSDRYPTYAEYARSSLLRLRVVKGLSEELISAIIIRGITDPQIRAAATNANLLPCDLVGFLSIYIKPAQTPVRNKHIEPLKSFAKKRTL